MAVTNFIPQIWSARLNENLKKVLVYGTVVNTDYEGDIRQAGDTVKINSVGAVSIGTYDGATGISAPEELNSSQVLLMIDQAKYFNFKVDDVDKAQANVNLLDIGMREAAYGLKDVMDTYIASLYTGVAAGNTIGDDTTPIVPTSTNAYDYLVDLGVILDENNVPEIDRFVIVPAWFHGLLLKDARFTKDPQIMATGYIGEVDGMKVFKSNNVPNTAGTKYKIIAGYKGAIAFAQQINNVEAYRPENFFADAVKGLALYGAKLIKPQAIAVLTANKA
jgi:hypothetical protein